MELMEIPPEKIGIWCKYPEHYFLFPTRFKESLEQLVKRKGWSNIPPVPVYELPEGFPHQYVLIDGHTRHEAARRMNHKLKCTVYKKDEIIDVVKDGLVPFGFGEQLITKDEYDAILSLYVKFNKSK